VTLVRPRVVVLDYGTGNLRSAERALARVGADVTVTAEPRTAAAADGLVVPGVGAFAACVAGLASVDAARLVHDRLSAGRPVLGICVGMQVMFAEGVEHGARTAGFGCWPGVVERLHAPVLPHVGWNTVEAPAGSTLLRGVDGERFYFVHSYAVTTWPVGEPAPGPVLTWAEHGQRFVAAAESGALSATQFHPEKSADAGAAVLENWLGTLR
jgi:imidazole glycerol-phosphate synthase subunit HisH